MQVNSLYIVHASRGRPQQAMDAAKHLLEQRREPLPVTYVFSLDTDDPTAEEYQQLSVRSPFKPNMHFIVSDNIGCVSATNKGMKYLLDQDLIFVNTEDIRASVGWDKNIQQFVRTLDTDTFLLHFKNTANSENSAIIQCMSAPLYRKLGYIFYPEYISMFGDTDLLGVTKAMGVCIEYGGDPVTFEHLHPTYGTAEWDDTYRRTNAPKNYEIGSAIYAQRASRNFDIV